MGYLTFFGSSFTLAAFFSVITNLLEVQIKLNSLGHYSRRFHSQPASGIGTWNKIINLIVILTIPINVFVILLVGEQKDPDAPRVQSQTVLWLMGLDPEKWNLFHIALLFFIVEHAVFGLSILIQFLIPDTPQSVKEEISIRKKIEVYARADIIKYKVNRNLDSLEDTIKKLDTVSKQIAKRDNEAERQKTIMEENERMKKVDPMGRAKKRRMTSKPKIKKFDLKDLQKIAIYRQKKVNSYQKHKKRFLRLWEKFKFQRVMATRLDDDEENDREFHDNSSIESEEDDRDFTAYVASMKKKYNENPTDYVDFSVGFEDI